MKTTNFDFGSRVLSFCFYLGPILGLFFQPFLGRLEVFFGPFGSFLGLVQDQKHF